MAQSHAQIVTGPRPRRLAAGALKRNKQPLPRLEVQLATAPSGLFLTGVPCGLMTKKPSGV